MNANCEPFVPRFTNNSKNNNNGVTYQPLGSQPHTDDDTAWTPLWSDMFQLAEQERERREFYQHEQVEESRRCFNQYVCQQRNLIHVQPERQIFCNVEILEEQGRNH